MSKDLGRNKTNHPETRRQEFETSDLNLSSFLRCHKCSFVAIKRHKDGRTVFVFTDSVELRRAVLDYANDGVVSVRSFCNTLRDLRAITRAGTPSEMEHRKQEHEG